jgi:hypothetical protein
MAPAVHGFVVFSEKLPDTTAQDAAGAAFQELVESKPELNQLVNSLPEETQLDLDFGFSSREMSKDEFESAMVNELAGWAAHQMTPATAQVPFVHTSSLRVAGPDGRDHETRFAIAVVIA